MLQKSGQNCKKLQFLNQKTLQIRKGDWISKISGVPQWGIRNVETPRLPSGAGNLKKKMVEVLLTLPKKSQSSNHFYQYYLELNDVKQTQH